MMKKLIIIILLSILVDSLNGITPTKFMANYCNSRSTIFVNGSLLLKLTDSFVENRYDAGFFHCATNIETDKHSKIYLHFVMLDIAHESNTPDRFHIYDFNDNDIKVQRTPSHGIYGVYERPYYSTNTANLPVQDYQSYGNKFRLDYLGKPTYMYQGFSILLTSVKKFKHNECAKDYFKCPKQMICVPGELRCDGFTNCGIFDGSDEFGCAELEETVTNLLYDYSVIREVIAAVVGVIVFLVCAFLIFTFINRYNQKTYPFTKARALLRHGVCTVSTNLDMERLYAPPSYEDVMAGTSKGNDPPPDYNEYIRTYPQHTADFTDSEDEEVFKETPRKEMKDYPNKRKGKSPQNPNKARVHKVLRHAPSDGASCSHHNNDVTPSPSSDDNSKTSVENINKNEYSSQDSENELKSCDSGFENSQERLAKSSKCVENNIEANERNITIA